MTFTIVEEHWLSSQSMHMERYHSYRLWRKVHVQSIFNDECWLLYTLCRPPYVVFLLFEFYLLILFLYHFHITFLMQVIFPCIIYHANLLNLEHILRFQIHVRVWVLVTPSSHIENILYNTYKFIILNDIRFTKTCKK